MKTMKKAITVLMVLSIVLALFGCSGGRKKTALKDYGDWFVNGFEPAYESFVNSGKAENIPSSDLSLLIASDEYVKLIFEYIKNGSQPAVGEITEKDGLYTYAYAAFDQAVEFSSEKTAMKITMHQYDAEETRIDFIATFAQEGNHYFLQFLSPDFQDYAEVKFTEKNGRSMRRGDLTKLPYDIFSADIPSGFAKEK